MRASLVCHRETEWMPSHGMDEVTMQWAARGFSQSPGLFSEGADRVAECMRRCVRWQGRAEGDGHWIGNSLWPFSQESTALKAEDASPDTIQVHGDDRYLSSLHDPFEASPKRQQCAGAGDLAFREDADDLTVVEGLPRAT